MISVGLIVGWGRLGRVVNDGRESLVGDGREAVSWLVRGEVSKENPWRDVTAPTTTT